MKRGGFICCLALVVFMLASQQPLAAAAPAPPTNLTATTVSSSQINLSWTASSGATSYNVLNSTTNGGPYTQVASGVATTSYSNTGLAYATTYYYVVQAVDAGGASGNSSQVSATTQAGSSGAPLILYTDLLSGPTSGGENNKGTYLSIFGQRFGTSGLGTTTKVFIGGVQVDNYRYLGASMGRPDIQQITVQVGALTGLTPGTAYPINVQVNGVNSTSYTSQTFTPNPGRILFISTTGSDSTAVANDITHPWGDIQASTWDRSHDTGAYGAWGAAQPGDVIVFRSGTYTSEGYDDSGSVHFCKFFLGPLGSAPTGASGTGPIAITGYPTETVTIHPPDSIYGVFDGVNSTYYVDGNGNPTMSQWITISNLTIATGGTMDGPINWNQASSHWRIVNNDLSAPTSGQGSGANGGGVAGNGTYDVVLGNHIHDVAGGTDLQNHGIYIDSGAYYEIAYNLIERCTGGSGIQTYDSQDTTPTMNYLNIHHNWIDGIAKHGINMADYTAAGVTIWDNIVYNTVAGCLRINSLDLTGMEVWNNLFYDCNTNHAGYAAIMNDWTTAITADFKNNIVWPSTASATYLGGSVGFGGGITFENNLWYGGTGTVSYDATGIYANPLLNNPGAGNLSGNTPDFHLQSGSPALNTGLTSVSSLVIDNYDLTPLPNGSGYYDVGAY